MIAVGPVVFADESLEQPGIDACLSLFGEQLPAFLTQYELTLVFPDQPGGGKPVEIIKGSLIGLLHVLTHERVNLVKGSKGLSLEQFLHTCSSKTDR